MNIFERNSAPVDWCEQNFVITTSIAEFFNTISNILFFIFPPILIYLFIPYGKQFDSSIHLVWSLLIIVGVCSTYFHATLSLAGQLLDELAILWVIHIVFALWFPRRLLPKMFKNNRLYFIYLITTMGILSTFLCCIKPSVNAFVLMTFGVPTMTLLFKEVKKSECLKVHYLGQRSFCLWALALVSWIVDRALCHPYLYSTFPYLHSLWHILILLATYEVCVLFAYFHAVNEAPSTIGIPVLIYWPFLPQTSTLKKNQTMHHRIYKYLIPHSMQLQFKSWSQQYFRSEIGRIPHVLFMPIPSNTIDSNDNDISFMSCHKRESEICSYMQKDSWNINEKCNNYFIYDGLQNGIKKYCSDCRCKACTYESLLYLIMNNHNQHKSSSNYPEKYYEINYQA